MASSPFQSALEAALSPLEFAARDDFANIDKLRDLEKVVVGALERACVLAIPKDVRRDLAAVAKPFAKPLPGDTRRREVERARQRLRTLSEDAFGAAALARSCSVLPGIGPRRSETLAQRGLRSVSDLLFHLPLRYDDRRSLSKIADLEVGRRVSFVATVKASRFSGRPGFRSWGGRTFEAVVDDETGSVTLKWFRGGEAIAKLAAVDRSLLVTGTVKRYRFSLELQHPDIEPVRDREADPPGRIVPDYPIPDGMNPRSVRRLIDFAVSHYADLVSGFLPETTASRLGLPEPAEALRRLHAPSPDGDLTALLEGRDPARTRLVLEELYLLEVGLALRRAQRSEDRGIPIAPDGPRMATAESKLPFALTRAQKRAWGEILGDLGRAAPMNRLLEGDVGSGKTAVAFLAAVAVADAGAQTALMAPTELLAEQHERTLSRLADQAGEHQGLRIALLTSSLPRAEANAVRRDLAAGRIGVVVGTHALVQAAVAFQRLALVITDEQHRFGVKQRAALAAKAGASDERDCLPHTLVMTATPIPRTLALTVHGDLDLSVIDELPPGRSPVKTLLVRSGEGRRVVELMRATVDRGEQVYVVYPLIEASEKLDLRAAADSAEVIARAFPDVQVALVHGRLARPERAEAMARFERGETHVLVSTTVIEVGVDVPGATLMVIEHAERFGLAQLHQLRGRVGRGERPGLCVLVARGSTEDSEARLRALLETTDGFEIAEADLRIRGPGEFLGTRQHGRLPDLRIADLLRDARHIVTAREAAQETLSRDPELRRSRGLLRAVKERWGDRLALVDVG